MILLSNIDANGGTNSMTDQRKRLAKRLYTIKEAAEYLGRSTWSMRELVWAGKIPFIKDGRKFYFDIKDLDEYIEKNKSMFI